MNYNVSDIQKDVRIVLNENSVSSKLIISEDIDTLEINEAIRREIPDAVRSVTQAAPSALLDEGVNFANTVGWESGVVGKGMGYTTLPEDFMRLLVFQMSDWKRPVTDAIDENTPKYYVQKSRFAGIRGGVEKPVCAIVTYPEGKVLEFYSCIGGSSVSVKSARYIPYPSIIAATESHEEQIAICRKLYTPVIYYTAGLVCMIFKDREHAEALFKLSNDYLT